MSMLSAETEALIKVHAIQSGRTPDEVVRDALLRRPRADDIKGHVFPGSDLTPEERLKRVREISERHRARPILDNRTDEEIIGFDENGLPS